MRRHLPGGPGVLRRRRDARSGEVDPKSDIEIVETELILADMQTLERALPRLEKEARTNKERKPLYDAALAAQQVLDSGKTLVRRGPRRARCCVS